MQQDEKDPLAMWMKELSDLETSRPLPDADLLWLKAQVLERAPKRWAWMDIAAWVPVGLALAWLATHVSDLEALIDQGWQFLGGTGMLPMPVLAIAATLALAAFALALPPLLNHD